MSCCFGCCKSADDLWALGVDQLEIIDTSNRALIRKDDIKDLIGALKLLRKAADQNHAGACYLFGSTFGKYYRIPQALHCTLEEQAAIMKVFKRALSEQEFDHSLFNRLQKNPNLLISTFCHNIAIKYLYKATRLGNQDANAEIQAIETYDKQLQERAINEKVAELLQQSKRRESSSAIMVPYQTF